MDSLNNPPGPPPEPQSQSIPSYNPQDYAGNAPKEHEQPPPSYQTLPQPEHAASEKGAPPLPPRHGVDHSELEDSPVHFTRDPKRLTGYLVPFPPPASSPVDFPLRFMIYTPPAPPLGKPAEGEKEGKVRKIQRKWQEEVRTAKSSDAKTLSWKGARAGATKSISQLMNKVTTSSVDFLGRMNDNDPHADDGHHEETHTKKTVGLEELVLLYPSTIKHSPEELRREFVESMIRTKSKAQKDAIIATGLLPVAEAIDLLATFVWPFGGLLEVDAVWAYGNIRGAKTARSVTKRLTSTGEGREAQLQLNFRESQRLEVLKKYLAAKCHERDAAMFPQAVISPTETQILEAIGWHSSQTSGETKNWEDEQWEIQEVKDDEKDPNKAIKK